jgi:hypothetical protein
VDLDMKYSDKSFGVFERLHLAESARNTGVASESKPNRIAAHLSISRSRGRTILRRNQPRAPATGGPQSRSEPTHS